MDNKIVFLCYVLIAVSSLYMIVASNDVVTENLKLYVDGQEYFIKAVCYSPAPLGQGVTNADGVVGGGFCSPKMEPYGALGTACYDSDYFDGGGDAANREQPTEGGWFQPVWERDFPLIKALGANTLRLYSANPTTKQASLYFPANVPLALGKDHVPFMDLAAVYGFKIIFPLIADYGMMTTYSQSDFQRLLRWQIDEVGNHTALLMWGFGNELPLYSNQALVNTLNMYITYIKQYTLTKWGRKIPVTTAVVDNPSSYDSLAATLEVDVFTTNAGYRGVSFTDLWAGNSVTQGWHTLSCVYNKPLLIGEIGWMSQNNAITYSNPTWFNQIWQDLVGHIGQGCIGGAFFEYSDEQGKADILQQTMGLVRFDVNTTNGLPSTEDYVWSADKATPKDIIYDAVRAGSYNGVAYNMNSDAFSLAGLTRTLLGATNSICSALNLLSCPAQNTCSFHGVCNRLMGTCTCNTGWTGADCSQPVCSSSCSGRGTCISAISPPVCNCQPGWTGSSCQLATSASTCASSCVAANGKCDANGNCVCFQGWLGSDCSLPDITYPPTTIVVPTTTASATTSKSSTSSVATSASASTSTATATSTSTKPTTSATSTTTTSTSTSKPTSTSTSTSATSTVATSTAATSTAATSTAATSTAATSTAATSTAATSTAATSTAATSTAATSTAATSTAAASTSAASTSAASTSAASTSAAATTSSTAASTVTTSTTSTSSSLCGALQSCGQACYDPHLYNCFSGNLCPLLTLSCGVACYNPEYYTCKSNQLFPVL